MLEILKAIILGVIEGLTEFIPISSSGHLILSGKILEFQSANSETFNIAIQLGAIAAVLVLYRKFFLKFFSLKNWFKKDMNNMIFAIIPVFFMGFIFYSSIKKYLFSPFTVAIGLLVGAIAMIVIEKKSALHLEKTKSIRNITKKQALLIGICQCFSLWPGFSRSGATIMGGLVSGLNHRTAAKFSFIIAVPVMFAAVGYDLLKSFDGLSAYDLLLILIGFVVSFFVALGSILWFIKKFQKLKLIPFAIYRIVLAVVILGFIYFY